MATTYVRNPQTNEFEPVNPGAFTTDTTLSQLGKPADAAAVGSALTNYATTVSVDTKLNAYREDLDTLLYRPQNIFSSLTDLGIVAFPTTMKIVSEKMPANSMIVIDTRRINGTGTDYSTETISDWGTTLNGIALIMKGVSTARVVMQILYGTTGATDAQLVYGNYAHDANRVNWDDLDKQLDSKVDKVSAIGNVNLNTITTTGMYYVTSGGDATNNFPTGTNGHLLVMSDGSRIRQVFFRVGTVNSNDFQWYSRSRSSDTSVGLDADGWSEWWLLSGNAKVYTGTAKLNAEINLGSRFGCQAWLIAGHVTTTDTISTIYIPRDYLTTDTTKYRFQIADESGYVSFYFYYKESDNNVYAKVTWVSDTSNSAIRNAWRIG